MEISGAVEATKFIRDRSKDIRLRINLARDIIDDKVRAIIPRRETVILEWAFDMLATDPSSKRSTEIWELLIVVWPSAPEAGRLRVFRNHKVIANISEALQLNSSEFVDLTTAFLKLISETIHLSNCLPDSQSSQLILAYLGNPYAITNNELRSYIYNATKSKPRIFGKCESKVLSLILNEPNLEIRSHYTRDYLSTSSNSVIPEASTLSDDDLRVLVEDLCAADVSVKDRIRLICSTFPDLLITIVPTLHAKRPYYVDAEMLKHVLSIVLTRDELDWPVLNVTLQINAGPLLENSDWVARIVSQDTIPDETMGLILLKAAQMRLLTDFLATWEPSKPLSSKLLEDFRKSIEFLSPLQVGNVLKSLSPTSYTLEILIRSLPYTTANSYTVKSILTSFLIDDQVGTSLKLHILELLPEVESGAISKKDKPEIALRKAETQLGSSDTIQRIMTKKLDPDSILLRFFPVLNDVFQENHAELAALVQKVSKNTRLQIASHPRGAECESVISVLIDASIKKAELEVLELTPKAVFSWDQRHEAVSVALKLTGDFALSGKILNTLVDTQNLPPAKLLGDFLDGAKANAEDMETLLKTLPLLRKDATYAKSVTKRINCDWLKAIIYSQLAQWLPEEFSGKLSKAKKWLVQAGKDESLMTPLLCVLSLMPSSASEVKSVSQSIVLQLIANDRLISRSLFQTLCRQDHRWYQITALFMLSELDCAEAFADYCKDLSKTELRALLFTAVEERLYRVLTVLAHYRVIPAEEPKYQMAVTVALASGQIASENSFYWKFCDSLMREYPKMISQFSLEAILGAIIRADDAGTWEQQALVLSRILLLKRQALRNRIHLVVAALTGLLQFVDSIGRARTFARLVDNLCNPPQPNHKLRNEMQALSSLVARERRHVSRHAGVLLQNIIMGILQQAETQSSWSEVCMELRASAFLLVDLIYGDGLKAVSAGMDTASRSYLRSVFEDYKLHGRWSAD